MRREHLLLGLIFIAVAAFRIYVALQTNYFDYDSYFEIRQIENIQKTGLPLFEDGLSYGGRTVFFLPLFDYLLAFFSFFMPLDIVLNVVPNLFAASMVLIVYLISLEMTRNRQTALFASFLAGFVPVFVYKTVNSVSPYTAAIPLIFLLIYFLMKVNEERIYVALFVITALILTLMHHISILFIIGLVLYAMFIELENLPHTRAELELILFSIFLILWIFFLFFKKPMIEYGTSIIWQNLPSSISSRYFANFSILDAIYKIGVLPFIFGIFVIYRYVFREKNKDVYLLISYALPIFIFLWLRLIKLDVGLMFLGFILILLFSQFYKSFFTYIKKTHFARLSWAFAAVFFVSFALSSVAPSFALAGAAIDEAPNSNEINAFLWIKGNTEKNDTILATPEEGHIITAISERKNVMDSNFLLGNRVEQRFNDINTIFTTSYETEAIRLLSKYDVKYIVVTKNAEKDYGLDDLLYSGDDKCFELVYNKGMVFIYKTKCVVEEYGAEESL